MLADSKAGAGVGEGGLARWADKAAFRASVRFRLLSISSWSCLYVWLDW